MNGIITLTLNPAMDKSTSVESIAPEKKLRCRSPRFQPGGGGVNVARAIFKLGASATAIFPAGGHTGEFFKQLLKEEGVSTDPVPMKSYTRENLIVLDESSGLQYRFGMPGPLLQPEEWMECLSRVKAKTFSYLVVSGSLPPGVPAGIMADLAGICREKSARMIADSSGEALREAARAGVYMLKPNLRELASLAGKEKINKEEIIPVCREFIARGAAEMMVISLGPDGAVMVTSDSEESVMPPQVKIKSTVGAGDSMVAGLVLSLHDGKSLREALRYGVSCGTAATLNAGTELCSKEDADAIMKGLQ